MAATTRHSSTVRTIENLVPRWRHSGMTNFIYGFKGLMQIIKPAGTEIANQHVKEFYVLEGLSESIKQGCAWLVSEEGEVCLH